MTDDTMQLVDLYSKFPHLLSRSEEETIAVGSALAGHVYRGLLVILSGGLGAGKTTLVRALARSLGVADVKSPTFVIESIHTLPERDFKLIHADLYRLDSVSSGSETAVQFEEYLSGPEAALLLVEWGERLESPQAFDRWDINISHFEDASDTNSRYFNFTAYGMRATRSLSAAYTDTLEKIQCR
jgi:tRNA threonylcarbamoyl adenosine modification protein YjeE